MTIITTDIFLDFIFPIIQSIMIPTIIAMNAYPIKEIRNLKKQFDMLVEQPPPEKKGNSPVHILHP